MTTWISRVGAALLGCLTLAGCDEGANGVFGGLGASSAGASRDAPLTQAVMMGGAVTLVPPTGFCVDPSSLRQSFALLARCDTLGASSGGRGAPLGVITVSFTPGDLAAPLPTAAEFTAAAGLSAPQRIRDRNGHTIFATTGRAPIKNAADLHWRGIARIGGHIMGVALYGAANQRSLSVEGAGLLEQLIVRTIARS